jgi:hypothetical protein
VQRIAAMRSYKMPKKGDHYSTGAPKDLFAGADRISAEMVTTRRDHNVRQHNP